MYRKLQNELKHFDNFIHEWHSLKGYLGNAGIEGY